MICCCANALHWKANKACCRTVNFHPLRKQNLNLPQYCGFPIFAKFINSLYVSKLLIEERAVTADQNFYPDDLYNKCDDNKVTRLDEMRLNIYQLAYLQHYFACFAIQVKFQCQPSDIINSPSKGKSATVCYQRQNFATCNQVWKKHSCVVCLHVCSCLFAKFSQVVPNFTYEAFRQMYKCLPP